MIKIQNPQTPWKYCEITKFIEKRYNNIKYYYCEREEKAGKKGIIQYTRGKEEAAAWIWIAILSLKSYIIIHLQNREPLSRMRSRKYTVQWYRERER